MSAKDIFHDCVRNALIKDGWTITNDPYILKWKKRKMKVDLAAEKIIAAEKAERKIAVEVKSFVGRSTIRDFEVALGQYSFYRALMAELEPDRELFLAVPSEVFFEFIQEEIGELLLKHNLAKVFGYDEEKEEIVGWIP